MGAVMGDGGMLERQKTKKGGQKWPTPNFSTVTVFFFLIFFPTFESRGVGKYESPKIDPQSPSAHEPISLSIGQRPSVVLDPLSRGAGGHRTHHGCSSTSTSSAPGS